MRFLFRKMKPNENSEQKKERILNLCDKGYYGLCPPPMDAQVAVNELCRYLLGEDWYTTMPVSVEQVNTEIVYAIELKFKEAKNNKIIK